MKRTSKDIILKDKDNARNLVVFDQHIVRKYEIYSVKKYTTTMLYLTLVDNNFVRAIAQDYFENLFETLRMFQYKVYIIFYLQTKCF